MNCFDFFNPTKIVFGKDKYSEVGNYIKPISNNVLVHFEGDGELLKTIKIWDPVIKSLEENNINYTLLGGVVPNPDVSLVRTGIDICREKKIDFILAIGGGSVIDSAKAIALGVPYEGDVWDFFTGKNDPKGSLDLGVVLTIPGSGSEMSESSIISSKELQLKCVCDSPYNFPTFSVLNPEVCYTIPKRLMAAGVADILSHLMERYFSTTKDVQVGDALLESMMRVVLEFGPKIMENPTDYNNCAQIMWASTVAHNGMIASGRAADWSSHRIEHELSAMYNITHGAGMAVVFPAWMKYVRKNHAEFFANFAKKVFNISGEFSDEELGVKAIEALEKFFISLGLKITLKDFEITDEHFELMAKKALAGNETLGRFEQLNKDDIVAILELAL